MKNLFCKLFQDPLDVGLILILLSASLLASTGWLHFSDRTAPFFICFIFSAGYLLSTLIYITSRHRWKFSQGKLSHTVLLLVLWFISAFALNREMNVFESSVDWLCVWIIISTCSLLLASRSSLLPRWFNYINYFLLGAALLLFSYYAIYLLPLYIISLFALIAIGLSLHTFIPLLLSTVTLILMIRAAKENRKYLYASIAGFIMPVLVCICFLISWNNTSNKINRIINQNTLNENKLPDWVSISQQIAPSFLSERILKSGIIYHEASFENMFMSDLPSRNFGDQQQHDPLVIIGTLLFAKPNLDENERIKILRSMYNARHLAQERLWSGDHLETIGIISNVKLFPEYRMAYTEKTVSIRNNSGRSWNNQEAIYTFHLSEGSVVSSLSLWVNGVEEKSRLTTKGKADSAYHQIVGIESRDPSVVHWQEGNTVSVRVFPCTTVENRKFKIGITSPLHKQGNTLFYENAFFDGPAATAATETIQVTSSSPLVLLQLSGEFEQMKKGVYQSERTYQPHWQISCAAPALASTVFSFDGSNYALTDIVEKHENFKPDNIYIDLNSAWSEAECKSVWAMVKNHPVYVIEDSRLKLTAENLDEVYHRMVKQHFSLFPIFEIKAPETALIISKSDNNSPNLNDLEGSVFAKELTVYCKTPKHIRFYNLGDQLNPYLKALKEFRVVNYTEGNLSKLDNLLSRQQFIKDQEDNNTVVIGNAQMSVHQTDSTIKQSGNAPDHLLRLFAYNDIMKKVGAGFFTDNYVEPELVTEAEKAYIVSPVSSLLVLETRKDYERFGIEESKNSLKNASMKSSGAVPEPEEWMLIALGVCVILYTVYRKKPLPHQI